MSVMIESAHRRLRRVTGRARAAGDIGEPNRPLSASKANMPAVTESERLNPLIERRRSTRLSLEANVMVRRVGGFNFEIALRDISPSGCKVEMLEPSEVGDPVITRFPQLEPLGSRVCWANGTTTGVQFLTTLHPAVFDSLLTRLADEQAA